MSTPDVDHAHMTRALALAAQAAAAGDVPVGAVLVKDGHVLAEAGNRREQDQDPTAHAEVVALRRAAHALGHWRLEGCTMYVTLEPCFMCAGALVNSRVARLVYAAHDKKGGAVASLGQVCTDPRLNHRLDVEGGLCAEKAAEQLRAFFQARRARRAPGEETA